LNIKQLSTNYIKIYTSYKTTKISDQKYNELPVISSMILPSNKWQKSPFLQRYYMDETSTTFYYNLVLNSAASWLIKVVF